jgi:heat shock protein HslJ
MNETNQPRHAKQESGSKRTRNILIVIIVVLAVILLAVLIPLTFCNRQDVGDGSDTETTESVETGEEEVIVDQEGVIDRITSEYIELDVDGAVILIHLDGYKLPDDLAVGDKVYVEYEVDKIAEQNILRYLEVLDKAEIVEPPTVTLEIYEGPVYVEKDGICYYRIKATVTGNPAPEISWSRDDSGGSLGADKAQIDLKDVDEKYTLEATAKNSEGTAKDKVEIKWGCEKPPTNRPPEIKEIVIMDDFYTETKYPVYVIASDPDGDELSYKWSASAGTVEKSTSNPMFWTTPASAGTYEIKVTVDDGNNGVATKAKNAEVKQKEQPPEPPEDEITGIIWQCEKFTSNDGSETIISDPSQYMLLLESDSTNMYFLADCNNGSGTYTIQGSSLTFNIGATTQAICGPDSLSDKYISNLGDVVSYVIEDGKLYLNLKADAGNMVFITVEATPF